MSDAITLVRWEPWELDGHDCWRCSISTGHGGLSWTTRYSPGDDSLTVEVLRRILARAVQGVEDCEVRLGERLPKDRVAIALLRRAIENLETQDE